MSDHRKAREQGEPLNSDDVLELSASDESEPEEEPRDAPFDPELDHSDDDGDVMTSTSASAPSAQSTFTLSGGSSGFSYRSRNIFDCLDTVEKRSIPSSNQGNSAESRKTRHPPSTSPIPVKKSAVPDYLVHPERWTRYSLEDVVESSDQDNRRVAFQFLSGLQRETKSGPPCDIKEKMIFSRPKRLPKDQAAVQLSPDLQGKEKELQLSHLEEEEDNEEREQAEAGEQIPEKTRQEETSKEKTVSRPVAQEEEKKLKESSANFTSFRKTKVKNYRKSSADKED
ncbi:protein TSSC4 [Fundulus heteroclitus]|uniref:protein TSSC4 n=1 Tax=Fundulus heteroclitus TaxID=8078 RepID=UPI00165C8640|nr:protein TSSC4 [Fundulus heteroclitus]XP_021171651.2 protein TSSC4 [Fundulus heteroclitus]XP_035992206.1 protein TSSC4 [Fundulus heteroclitus]